MQICEILQSLFESKQATLSSISRLSGIHKGTLHRFVNGERDVKFNELMRISSALGLSSAQKALLFDTFFNELYGEKEMELARFVISQLPSAYDPLPVAVPDRGYDTYPENGFMPDMEKVHAAIFSVTEIESGKIYTNFPFENKILDEFFFRKAQNKDIELLHFVRHIQKDGDKENIYSLIRALRYMNIGAFPYVSSDLQFSNAAGVLPYFVVTQKGAVLFNERFGFITVNKISVSELIDTIENAIPQTVRIGRKPTDIMDIKNTAASIAVTEKLLEFCKYPPCLAKYITREMMQAAANDVPHKDQLIDICAKHYAGVAGNKNIIFFTTVAGLEDFACTGNFYGIPPEFVHEFSPEIRVEILNKTKNDIETGNMYILRRNDAIPDGLVFECGIDYLTLRGTDTTIPQFALGMGFVSIFDDMYYIKLTHIVAELLIANGYVHNTDAALQLIDTCIALAENDMQQAHTQ